MRKILFLLIAMTGFFTASAQNLSKIKTMIEEKKYIDANTALDEVLKVPKSQKSHEVHYLKSKVLSAIAADPELRKKMPGTRMKALDAFKKALELDKNETMMLMNIDKYEPVVSLYTLGFEEGADHYNNARYEESYNTFKEAGTAGEYIFSQGWGLYKLDTTLTLYLGLSALNAKKEDEAIVFFTKIADENIGGTPDRATPYRFLAKYYYDKKDEAKMKKYMDAGLKLYPQDDYLPQLMIESVRDKNDMALLFKTYEELLVINPESFDVIFDYASDLFGETHVSESSKKAANYQEQCAKIEGLYEKALSLKPDSYITMLSLGKHFYNQMLFVEEDLYKIKGQGPEQTKKRADISAVIDGLGNKAIPRLEAVFNYYDKLGKLKVNDKSNFKSSCSLLTYCYNMKKDKAKADFYQKKYDEADKAHE
ncbi:MAG: tetratricopeptide repeat protein [bacterium]